MAHSTHSNHTHTHNAGCGHTAVRHGDHVDYLHEGHLHHPEGAQTRECTLEATAHNPTACTPQHACNSHASGHQHGPGCGHEVVPHAGHMDYLVSGHLHHPHGAHCDDHGALQVVA
jgi:hypothetical protein